ncbi:unnamed protein product [Leptosia nina]|uniref:ribonuclease H n=1 Tax=Leptosia nina TaxID=320188 RepID=A0AAV1IV97_9NEOP
MVEIVHGFRTLSTITSISLAQLIPLPEKIKSVATIETSKHLGYSSFLPSDIPLEKPSPPSSLLHPSLRTPITFTEISSMEEFSSLSINYSYHIFTDGSKHDGVVGAAFVAFDPCEVYVTKKFKLHPSCSVFQAEMLAIHKACEWIASNSNNINSCIIFSDSKSSLQELSNPYSYNTFAVNIFHLLHTLSSSNINVGFAWVKAHIGIAGNEIADIAAKSAASLHKSPDFIHTPISHIKLRLRDSLMDSRKSFYEQPLTSCHTKKYLPTFDDLSAFLSVIKPSFAITQFLTNHSFNKSYLHRFNITPDDLCPCDSAEKQTFDHLIFFSQLIPLPEKIKSVATIETSKHLGYSSFLPSDIPLEKPSPPSSLLHPSLRTPITFTEISSMEEFSSLSINYSYHIFTDGSKHDGVVGAAFVAFDPCEVYVTKKFKLHPSCSVFQAEMLAIHKACEWIASNSNNINSCIIFSDSKSSLQELSNPYSYNTFAVNIFHLLHTLSSSNINVGFAWVKAHIGIAGNEIADIAAKSAASLHKSPDFIHTPISHIKLRLRDSLMDSRKSFYEQPLTSCHTKKYLPTFDDLSAFLSVIKPSFAITQFLTNHSFNKSYLHRFNITPDDLCPCDSAEKQTFDHLIFFSAAACRVIKRVALDGETTQVLTGHGGLAAYLHRFKRKDSPVCACGDEDETVPHLLVRCPIHALERHKLENRLDIDMTESNLKIIMMDDGMRPPLLQFWSPGSAASPGIALGRGHRGRKSGSRQKWTEPPYLDPLVPSSSPPQRPQEGPCLFRLPPMAA